MSTDDLRYSKVSFAKSDESSGSSAARPSGHNMTRRRGKDGSFLSHEVESSSSEKDSHLKDRNDGNIIERKQSRSIICLRSLTVMTLVVAALLVCILTFYFARSAELKEFEHQYYDTVIKVDEQIKLGLQNKILAAKTLAKMYTSLFGPQNVWPNATMPDFNQRVESLLALSNSMALSFNPIINSSNRADFEAHAALYGDMLQVSQLVNNYTIYRRENDTVIDDPGIEPDSIFPDVMVPVYQIYPSEENWRAIMFNLHSEENRQNALDDMLLHKVPTLTALLHLVQHPEGMRPSSILFYPIFSKFGSDDIVGSISIVFLWEELLRRVLPNYVEGLIAVLESSVSINLDPINGLPRQLWTYEIVGGDNVFFDEGDQHDNNFNRYEYEINTSVAFEGFSSLESVDNLITFKIRLYPSVRLRDHHISRRPVIYTIIMLFIFIFVSLVFLAYDYLHTRQQNKVMAFAKRSGRIVDSLFPIQVKNRLFDASENVHKQLRFQLGTMNKDIDSPSIQTESVSDSRKEGIKKFLKLPSHGIRKSSIDTSEMKISTLLTINTPPIADYFPETSIMFADIVGFTKWSSDHEPEEVFHLLETLYFEFDKIAERLGVFKLGTIGDCYLAVTGIPDYMPDHAVVMCRFAHECRLVLNSTLRELEHVLGNVIDLSMRFGVHSGPVIAGVLRGQKSRFELFGDTINTASRMESTGKPQMVQISCATANLLIDAGHSDWFEPRDEKIRAKGKGELQTFWLMLGDIKPDKMSIRMDMHERGLKPFYQSIIDDQTDEMTSDSLRIDDMSTLYPISSSGCNRHTPGDEEQGLNDTGAG